MVDIIIEQNRILSAILPIHLQGMKHRGPTETADILRSTFQMLFFEILILRLKFHWIIPFGSNRLNITNDIA